MIHWQHSSVEIQKSYDYIQNNSFSKQFFVEKLFPFKMSIKGGGNGHDLVKRCNLGAILKHVGSCLIVSSVLDGWPRLATCMIQFTIKWWWL